MGWAPTLTWLPWGPQWGLHRKVLSSGLNKEGCDYYKALQKKQAMILCKNLIERPEEWMSAVTHFAVSIMMRLAYGIDVETPSDEWVKMAAEASEAVGKAGAPASSIMDRIPWSKFFLSIYLLQVYNEQMTNLCSLARHLPDWLPFMERLRYARENKQAIYRITERPFTASMADYVSLPPENTIKTRLLTTHIVRAIL